MFAGHSKVREFQCVTRSKAKFANARLSSLARSSALRNRDEPGTAVTNWSRFSDAAADVISPLLAYEGLTAFFLEAAFLGVLLFGRKLVPPWAHFVSALMVALGTLSSTFWILATNSWMQTPAGYESVKGRFLPYWVFRGKVRGDLGYH